MSAEPLLAAVREATNALRTYDCTPDEVADATADCRALEVDLAEWRHRQEQALNPAKRVASGKRVDSTAPIPPPVAVGRRYELVPQYKVDRTYNTGGILTAFSAALDRSLAGALAWLVDREAVVMQWKISKLQPAATEVGVPLTRVKGTVEEGDLDGPMVGEIRKLTGYQRVPLEGD